MEIKVKRDKNEIVRITLEQQGEQDRIFLTRLFKALALHDPIEIPTGRTNEVISYVNGGDPVDIGDLEWTDGQ